MAIDTRGGTGRDRGCRSRHQDGHRRASRRVQGRDRRAQGRDRRLAQRAAPIRAAPGVEDRSDQGGYPEPHLRLDPRYARRKHRRNRRSHVRGGKIAQTLRAGPGGGPTAGRSVTTRARRRGDRMNRRELMLLLGAMMIAPRDLRAQQKAMSVIGYLATGSPDPKSPFTAAFRQGLSETGYVEGQNLAIQYRSAEGHHDRLPALAADLVGRKVDAIATSGGASSALAAKA